MPRNRLPDRPGAGSSRFAPDLDSMAHSEPASSHFRESFRSRLRDISIEADTRGDQAGREGAQSGVWKKTSRIFPIAFYSDDLLRPTLTRSKGNWKACR